MFVASVASSHEALVLQLYQDMSVFGHSSSGGVLKGESCEASLCIFKQHNNDQEPGKKRKLNNSCHRSFFFINTWIICAYSNIAPRL